MRQKNHYVLFAVVVIFIFQLIAGSAITYAKVQTADKSNVSAKMAKTHIPFIQNNGQMDKNVKFYAKTFGGTVFVTEKGEIVYSLPKKEKDKTTGIALQEELIGGSVKHVNGKEKAQTKVSYFKGKDPKKWQSNITTYDLIDLGKVYTGINLKLKAYGNNVEKLFYVKPDADPKDIGIKLKGVKGLSVNAKGELEAETYLGNITFSKPVAYQEIAGKKRSVDVIYAVNGDKYSFELGKYDTTNIVVIDPLLASTFLRDDTDTAFGDLVQSIITKDGYVYMAGVSNSSDYPVTSGAFDETCNGDYDVVISKFDSDLTTLLASTYLGGSAMDAVAHHNMVVDESGNIYLAGFTHSSDFPVSLTAYDKTLGGDIDCFLSKFNDDLTDLLASTYLGGDEVVDHDGAFGIAIDTTGNIYIAGHGVSDFPTTPGAYDVTCDIGAAVISKLDSNFTTLLASTFLDGSSFDQCTAIALDGSGNVFVAGFTSSSDFPTTSGAYDETLNGSYDNFVSKFDASLTSLSASTYFCESTTEGTCFSMTIDGDGNVYVAGSTDSSGFVATTGAYDETYNGDIDGFISKFSNDLTTLVASTFIGGGGLEEIYSIYLDETDMPSPCIVYVAGCTGSSDFPATSGAYDEIFSGSWEGFVSKFDSSLTTLSASTFVGGNSTDMGMALTMDTTGNIYVTGTTESADFPTTIGAYDEIYNGQGDSFISKLDNGLQADINDSCPDDPEKTDSGICGCGIADTDTDLDGTPDCNDECPDDPNKIEPGECGCGKPEGSCEDDNDGGGSSGGSGECFIFSIMD